MSGRSNTFKNKLLKLIFNNISFGGIGDIAGILSSNNDGNLYVRLYTSTTPLSDTVLGNEALFQGYIPGGVAVPRNVQSWNVVNNSVNNLVPIPYPKCTFGEETIRYFAIWINNTSNLEADRLYWGQLNNDVIVALNTTISFVAGDLNIIEN